MLRLNEFFVLFFLCYQTTSSNSRAGSSRSIVEAPLGSDALLPCVGAGSHNVAYLGWRHVGTSRRPNKMLSNGSLLVENASNADAGDYACTIELDGKAPEDIAHVELVVIAPPPPVDGLEARANANFATISWKNLGTDRGFLDGFRISYSVASDKPDWIEPAYLREISPSSQIIDMYHLMPDTPYIVRMEAFNAAGSSRPVTVTFRTASDGKRLFSSCGESVSARQAREGDHRLIWIFAAGTVVCGLLMVLAIPFCVARYRRASRGKIVRSAPVAENADASSETIELIPNIVVNPGFDSEAAQKSLVCGE